MTGLQYQNLAMRTCSLEGSAKENHALHGLVGEIGEIHSLYQKQYQGHPAPDEKLKEEIGDLLWFVAELIDSRGWSLNEIMEGNITKLQGRYPDGFEVERSINRGGGR